MLERIKKQVDISLKNFLHKIKYEYRFHLVNPILYKSITDFSLRKGKRIRPLLLILSYLSYSKKRTRPSRDLYDLSICVELLHIFMLIHDDIIDESNLRRGKPTMHRLLQKTIKTKDRKKLGYNLSIVAGDIVYSLAIDAFLSIKEDPYRKEAALKYFIKTAAITAIGEFIDTQHGFEDIRNISEKDVFLNYTLKTARYTFECPLVVGATLAGANKNEINRLSKFGLMLGKAFQIQDDILGIFGSQKGIGKSILSDLIESKKTILTSHAFRKLNPYKRKIFLYHFSKKNKSYTDLIAIRKLMLESKSLHYSLNKMNCLIKEANKIVYKLKMKNKYRNLILSSISSLFAKGNEIAKKTEAFPSL